MKPNQFPFRAVLLQVLMRNHVHDKGSHARGYDGCPGGYSDRNNLVW